MKVKRIIDNITMVDIIKNALKESKTQDDTAILNLLKDVIEKKPFIEKKYNNIVNLYESSSNIHLTQFLNNNQVTQLKKQGIEFLEHNSVGGDCIFIKILLVELGIDKNFSHEEILSMTPFLGVQSLLLLNFNINNRFDLLQLMVNAIVDYLVGDSIYKMSANVKKSKQIFGKEV